MPIVESAWRLDVLKGFTHHHLVLFHLNLLAHLFSCVLPLASGHCRDRREACEAWTEGPMAEHELIIPSSLVSSPKQQGWASILERLLYCCNNAWVFLFSSSPAAVTGGVFTVCLCRSAFLKSLWDFLAWLSCSMKATSPTHLCFCHMHLEVSHRAFCCMCQQVSTIMHFHCTAPCASFQEVSLPTGSMAWLGIKPDGVNNKKWTDTWGMLILVGFFSFPPSPE